jgi:pyruvate,water dikinase
MDDVPTIEASEAARDPAPHVAEPGDVLTGSAGCSGVARGRARVILDPGDALDLEPGEVLIAPITDPAWTPLFLPAAAVVVNVGALMSHAVIVSRELAIPCVVAVEAATERIQTGTLVEVDGTAGTVTILGE